MVCYPRGMRASRWKRLVWVGDEGLSEVCAVTGAFVGGEVALARLQKPVKSHEVAHSGERFFKVVPGVIEKALLERVLFTAKKLQAWD